MKVNGTLPASNFIGDPKFVNPAQGNFKLQKGSPAIDKGATLSDVPCDFDGNRRPAGSAYDMGAFEYGGIKDSNCASGIAALPPATASCNSIPSGTSWNNAVTVKAETRGSVIIKPRGDKHILTTKGAYIVLDGLIIDGSDLTIRQRAPIVIGNDTRLGRAQSGT